MSEDGVKKHSNPLISMTAGTIAGGVECISVWPMEYIKTQLQLQSKARGPPPFTGVISGLTYTVRTTGFLSLYRGLGITLVFSMPKAGIRFGGNAYFKQLLADERGKLTMAKQFMAGLGAGATEAVLAVTPMETIKTKLIQTNQPLVAGVSSILRESGFRGLYQGVMATVLKQSSNQGLRFMFFNKYKDLLTGTDGGGKLSPLLSLIGGMMAGCFSTLGNNPFDVVKTQMQSSDAKARYSSTADCFVQIFKQEGLAGMGRVVPGQGVIFMSFESIQTFVEAAMVKKH
eukprot:gene24915-33408_t